MTIIQAVIDSILRLHKPGDLIAVSVRRIDAPEGLPQPVHEILTAYEELLKELQSLPGSTRKQYKVNTPGETLNIRSGPGASFERVGRLNHGAIITELEARDGWVRIAVDRWISAAWLVAM
jgi:hypothetical protein